MPNGTFRIKIRGLSISTLRLASLAVNGGRKDHSVSRGISGRFFGETRDKMVVLPSILSALFVAFSLIFLLLSFNNLPSEVPLFYSRPWGEPQVTLRVYLFLLPGLSFLVFFASSFFGVFLYSSERFLFRVLVFTSLSFSFLCFVTLLKIILLF